MKTTPTAPEMILFADGFTAGPELVSVAEAKAAKLHRHAHPRIGSIRVRVTRETPHSEAPHFSVCLTARRSGAECVVHSVATEPEPAVDEAFHKLERLIANVSGERRAERRHPHGIEFAIALPKI